MKQIAPATWGPEAVLRRGCILRSDRRVYRLARRQVGDGLRKGKRLGQVPVGVKCAAVQLCNSSVLEFCVGREPVPSLKLREGIQQALCNGTDVTSACSCQGVENERLSGPGCGAELFRLLFVGPSAITWSHQGAADAGRDSHWLGQSSLC